MSIPKLIHQTWKNLSIPDDFQLLMNTWKEFHPDWKFILWTDEMNRNFIGTHYPHFLNRYDSYPTNIQRADAIRYFLLYHYGGVYIDLDFECLQNIEDLLIDEECVFGLEPQKHCERFNTEKIICNAFMATTTSNNFFEQLCTVLNADDYDYKSTSVLNTTGPFMLTKVYDGYGKKEEIKILPSHLLYPITIEESREVINGTCDEHLEAKIQSAYGIHYFWGTWWEDGTPGN